MSSKKKMRSNSMQSFHKNVNRVTPLSAIYTRRKCPPKKPKLGSAAKRQYWKDVRYERLAYMWVRIRWWNLEIIQNEKVFQK